MDKKQELKKFQFIDKTHSNFSFKVVKDLANQIDTLSIIGGEPLINPDFYEIVDFLVEGQYSKNIRLEITTNGSKFINNLKKLQQFKTVNINISIDDIKERFEIQRGGSWNTVYENIKKFKKLQSNNFFVSISTTVNIQNLLYLDNLIDFVDKMELTLLINYLEKPWYYCVDNINEATKSAVLEKYSNHENQHLKNLVKKIKNIKPCQNTEFLEQTKKFDQRRKQKFIESHREIVDLMSQS